MLCSSTFRLFSDNIRTTIKTLKNLWKSAGFEFWKLSSRNITRKMENNGKNGTKIDNKAYPEHTPSQLILLKNIAPPQCLDFYSLQTKLITYYVNIYIPLFIFVRTYIER